MIRKSNYLKDELVAAIGREVQRFQDATDEVDEAAARHLRLNRTDLRCLSVLSQSGVTSASQLADAAGLTRGAMTTALDRLEAAGYARRVRDRGDRRNVLIELTDTAKKEVGALYGPLATEGFQFLRRYTAPALAAVLRYLEQGGQLQRAHARRIRGLSDSEIASDRPARERRPARSTKASRENLR